MVLLAPFGIGVLAQGLGAGRGPKGANIPRLDTLRPFVAPFYPRVFSSRAGASAGTRWFADSVRSARARM